MIGGQGGIRTPGTRKRTTGRVILKPCPLRLRTNSRNFWDTAGDTSGTVLGSQPARRGTLEADKAYGGRDFVERARAIGVTPHVA